MDSIILSLAIKLYKKILSFMRDYQSDFFGTGKQGNVYIGNVEDNVPSGYTYIKVNSGESYNLPISVIPQYENLIISDGANLTSETPYLFLYVRDTLTIKNNSSINMDSRGDGSYTFSPFLPKPSIGSSTPGYTTACLKMFLSGREVRTPLDLLVCGGNKGGVALSGGGTSGAGGGLVCIYHMNGGFKDYTKEYIHANGGTTGDVGGGMLIIFAKNIVLEGNARISSDGGDGNGLVSYIDDVPRSTNSSGSSNTGNTWGGSGVVARIPLEIV